MNKTFLTLFLIIFAAAIFAAEPAIADVVAPAADVVAPAADVVAPAADVVAPAADLPAWVMILGTILTAVITFLAGFAKKKWGAEETKAKLDANKSLMEQKNFLIDNRLIPFAIATAEHWLLTQLMVLVKDAADGGEFHWKNHYNNLKAYVKDRVVKKFAAENLDIIEQLGEKELDNLIERHVIKLISKLPDSIAKFVPESVAKMLSEKASEFIVDKSKDLLGVD
jgi:hypothetical protein